MDRNFPISENPKYQEDIRMFDVEDPAHADIFNKVVQALINNDTFIKKCMEAHLSNEENPHNVSKEAVGLGNVDNTADADKNVATADIAYQVWTQSHPGWYINANFDGNTYFNVNTKSGTDELPIRVDRAINAENLIGFKITPSVIVNIDCNTLYDAGIYLISGGINCPCSHGSLLVMPYRKATGNSSPDFGTQIFIPNGDDSAKPNSMFYRTSLRQTWNEWKEVAKNPPYADDMIRLGNINHGGLYSISVGNDTWADKDYAACFGDNTIANNYSGFVCGKYNVIMHEGTTPENQIGDAFIIGNGAIYSSNAMRVTYAGDIYGTRAFQSSGADYAEFIKPWHDGNEKNEDRIGYFVTIRDGFLHKAETGDYIAGITSGNPSIVGNADEDYYWRYERDVFNRIVMEDVPEIVQKLDEDGTPLRDENGKPVYEETGKIIPNARMKLAEGYDPSLQNEYVERKNRKEWDYVGMMGVLPVRDDGTCVPGRFCKCGEGGTATLAEERGIDTYFVIERKANDVVSVLLK